jgi:hypothetical protein
MHKRVIIGFTAMLLSGGIVAEEAYRWVDEAGVVHYSDRPEPGAEAIDLPTYEPKPGSSTTTPASSRSRGGASQSGDAAEPFGYTSLTVASPASEETLWNIEGVLNVSLSLQPGLRSGHRLQVYFDGTPQTVTGTSFQLEGVYRGQHNLQAEVIDQSGNLMIRSEPSRFYVQQNAIGQ